MMQSMLYNIGMENWRGYTDEEFQCPNKDGMLIFPKRRIPILHLLPELLMDKVCEDIELSNVPEEAFEYITAICPECGFCLTTREKLTLEEKEERTSSFFTSVFSDLTNNEDMKDA